ncbi:rhodanese-like domain-containing protein [Paenibacillus sp. JTLBN-2024]
MDEHGKRIDVSRLQEHYKAFPRDKEIVVYCRFRRIRLPELHPGLKESGIYENVKLYAGSWSDWISYSENPVATGEE